MQQNHLTQYEPNNLINTLIQKLGAKNDAALCRILEVMPPVISKIRHGKLPVGASMLIRMHEETGLSIRELRDMMGDRRKNYRVGSATRAPA